MASIISSFTMSPEIPPDERDIRSGVAALHIIANFRIPFFIASRDNYQVRVELSPVLFISESIIVSYIQ